MNPTPAKRFLIRCDVSPVVGLGHLRRCIALAFALDKAGSFVLFVCRIKSPDDLKNLSSTVFAYRTIEWETPVESDSLLVAGLYMEHNIDVAIIDHYRADHSYQQILLDQGVHWLQFDWAASSPISADWVICPSPAADHRRYRQIVRQDTRLLLGPRYAILSPDFSDPGLNRKRNGQVRNALVLMGGGYDRGALLLTLDAIISSPDRIRKGISWEIVTGGTNPNLGGLRKWFEKNSEKIHARMIVDAKDVASRIAKADLAITAGGTVAFETAVLHCPSIILSITDNQVANATKWEKLGTAKYLGPVEEISPSRMAECIRALVDSPAEILAMSKAASGVIDSEGVKRVAEELLS